MDVDGDATAVVGDGYGFIRMDSDDDTIAIAGQSFVDGIIDDLEDHVVQAGAVIGVPDVHAGALAHRIEALQNFDFAGVVDVVRCHEIARFMDGALYRGTPPLTTLKAG